MSEVKRYMEFCGEGGGVAEHAEGGFVEFKDFDAQRLRADTAEADVQEARNTIEAINELLLAYEQRIALMSKLLKRCIPVCRFKNSHTERDLIADINAALNPNPEAESHEN